MSNAALIKAGCSCCGDALPDVPCPNTCSCPSDLSDTVDYAIGSLWSYFILRVGWPDDVCSWNETTWDGTRIINLCYNCDLGVWFFSAMIGSISFPKTWWIGDNGNSSTLPTSWTFISGQNETLTTTFR
jgi:hypothetical protein